MPRTHARLVAIGASVVLALTAGACASDDDEPSAAGGQSTPSTSPAESTSSKAPFTIIEKGSDEWGDYVADSEGFTLYAFDQDTGAKSTCTGECATNWPAYTTSGKPTCGTGLDESLLGTTGGGMEAQVTYGGHPLYHYIGDVKPGDTNGQGISDVWHVVGLDGTPITEAGDDRSGGGGYSY